jgi:hypothetical protein
MLENGFQFTARVVGDMLVRVTATRRIEGSQLGIYGLVAGKSKWKF